MASQAEIVRQFCSSWGTLDQFREAFRTFFGPPSTWENVGMSVTTGPEEVIALIEHFDESANLSGVLVDMISIAEMGNNVLTERVERILDRDGKEILALRTMGIFEVEGGKIRAWRDYFGPTPFQALLA